MYLTFAWLQGPRSLRRRSLERVPCKATLPSQSYALPTTMPRGELMSQSLHEPTSNSAGAEGASRHVDFFALPRPIQDRVVASLTGQGVPEIIAFEAPSQWLALRFLAGAAFCVVGLCVLASLGYGDLQSALALHPSGLATVYVALGLGAGVGVGAYVRQRSAGDYPFRLGCYLFPVGVIEVKPRQISILSLAEQTGVEGAGQGRFAVSFGRRRFRFSLPERRTLQDVKSELEEHRSRLTSALAASDRRALAGLDPVRDSGFSNPLSSRAPLVRPKQRYVAWGALALAGACLAMLFFLLRNELAERSLYRQAVELNTPESYRSYLERGGDRSEVAELLLPRAELMAASGNLDAVEAYAANNPDSKIRDTIDAVLRLELLEELQRALADSDLAAIEAFKERHPGYAVVAKELEAARREVFQRAFTQFDTEYSPTREVRDFVQQLVHYSEQHGPTVHVRFVSTLPPSIERADSAVRRSAYFTGSKAVPSRYFSGQIAEAREKRAATALVAALQSAFDPTILRFAVADGPAPSPLQVPTLVVEYKTEMSGGYTTNRPRGVYVGLGMMFQADWQIPERDESFKFKDSSWLPPDVNEISRNMMTHEQVYEKNATEGFERFVRRFVERVLGERTANGVTLESAVTSESTEKD